MRLPRWMHQVYAVMSGRAWTPCPACDRPFGAHEWLATKEAQHGGHIATVWDPEKHLGEAICPDCTRAGVGCLSHFEVGRVHAGCPYVLGRDVRNRRGHD